MPQAYTTRELHKTYGEIALERVRRCDECGTDQRLSHSHLIHKSYYGQYNGKALAVVKENIVYHCLSMGNIVGCHDKFDSMNVAKMKNFEKYFRTIHELDRKFFWRKMHSLLGYWASVDVGTWKRVNRLSLEIDLLENPHKATS